MIYWEGADQDVKKIRKILEDLNLNFTENVERYNKNKDYYICGNKLKQTPLDSYCFRISAMSSKLIPLKNKKLPDWCYELSNRQFKIFLKA